MSNHISSGRLHDLVDGLLSSSEVADVRSHLETCSVCREEHALLAEAVGQIRALPRTGTVPEGLWTNIETRIGVRAPGSGGALESHTADVVPIASTARPRRTMAFSLPQLAAAAALVWLLGSGTAWLALSSRPTVVAPEMGVAGSEADPATRAVLTTQERYDLAASQLEAALDRGHELLSRETLMTLEYSLRTIDTAIDDVRRALEADPGSDVLVRVLANHQRIKLGVLRQAATSLHARS